MITYLQAGVFGTVVFMAMTVFPAHGTTPVQPQITAVTTLPCKAPCTDVGRTLSIRYRDVAGNHKLELLTSIDQDATAEFNNYGNIVVTGTSEGSVTVIAVINPYASPRPGIVTEFYTSEASISPGGRFIAFTAYSGLHGAESAYSGTMVYVYDAATKTIGSPEPEWLPPGANPAYPPELRRFGENYIRERNADSLAHVFSTDFKWVTPMTVAFIAQQAEAYFPVLITIEGPAAGGPFHADTIVSGALKCNPPDRGRYDDIIKTCGPTAL